MARISVNKLAELLVTANPARRRKIIQDQKYPSTSIVALYRLAYEPIKEFLTNGRNEQSLTDAISRLRNDRSGSEWSINDRWNTADALEEFSKLAELVPNDSGEVYEQGSQDAPKLNIAGVDISVRPDFLIGFTSRGKIYTGALKLHFIKNPDSALSRTGAEYVATLMNRWLEDNGPDGSIPSHRHCMCIDVFRGTVVTAPKSTTRRMSEVTAACEEIAARWPHL